MTSLPPDDTELQPEDCDVQAETPDAILGRTFNLGDAGIYEVTGYSTLDAPAYITIELTPRKGTP